MDDRNMPVVERLLRKFTRSIMLWNRQQWGVVVGLLFGVFVVFRIRRALKARDEERRRRRRQQQGPGAAAAAQAPQQQQQQPQPQNARPRTPFTPTVLLSRHTPAQKVCIYVNSALVVNVNGEPRLVDGGANILCKLATHCRLYLIIRGTGALEGALHRCIRESGAFDVGLKLHRVLVCTTARGVEAIARHLEPDVLIADVVTANALRRFIRHSISVGPLRNTASPTNNVSHITEYFAR